MTSLEALSREQLDAMRKWLLRRAADTNTVSFALTASDEDIAAAIERFNIGGVSAFLADHEGERANG